jgi:sulfide:quinone oxidoreductase
VHEYQPGFLFLPFSQSSAETLRRPETDLLADGVQFVLGEVVGVDADACTVSLRYGDMLAYDLLIIATGTSPRPAETPGMQGPLWRRSIFDFYTLDGAMALRRALSTFTGGRLVVHVTEMPIKCPVAPLEFAFLADSWLRERGHRGDVQMTYVTPLSGAFTKPIASARLGRMLDRRGIKIEPDFVVERVDTDASALVSYDEREVPFDLLVTVPVNMGPEFIGRSGLGDELNYVPVDMHTLQSKTHDNVFAIGDVADIPASKAGSVAHFCLDSFVDNLVDHAHGRPMNHAFDGHANCFVETGHGRALLIDFNYDTQPLPGSYPLPFLGPLRLLKETRTNHLGKLAFRWLYWHVLLPGRPLPLPSHLSMLGKLSETTEV